MMRLGAAACLIASLSVVGCGDSAADAGGETGESGTSGDGDGDTDGTETSGSSGDGDGDATGDGDGDASGDGDGDPATGDGDGDGSGDGDGDGSGDGDGDGTGDGDGEGTGDGDGDGTGDGDGDGTGDGDGDGTGDGDGDGTGDGDGDDPNQYAPWILHVEEPDQMTDRLVQIFVDENNLGQRNVICEDLTLPDGIPSNTAFTSLTFNSNVLYASVRKFNVNGDTLLRINPCDCTTEEVGQYGNGMYDGLNGITSNEIQDMFGSSSTDDIIIDIDPETADAGFLADLPGDWGSTGLTWSDPVDNVLYGINATNDRLYTFDGDNAMNISDIQMNGNFGSVGIEYHPGFDVLYACGIANDNNSLYSVDIDSGMVTQVVADAFEAVCDNLAAPFGPVDCIPM